MTRTGWALAGVGLVVVAIVAKKKGSAYIKEPPAGPRPIEGVGTAVAP